MSNVIIRVDQLGKKYRIRHRGDNHTTLRDAISGKFASLRRLATGRQLSAPQDATEASVEDFWALKDVSFEVKRGEVMGVIGRNGAGKSTLLKILSRVTEPSEGRVELNGHVASLLEVGTGFHPELTGRENIYLNGAILGMGRAEIARKFDEIVSFAEVEQFLDTPVKRYSSGMYVRLAFAVAAHLEPDILIVDEVLAVGDAAFQKKCLGKMSEVSREGRTVLFVSHNMGAVRTLTRQCIYLESGRVAAMGETRDVAEIYLARSLDKKSDPSPGLDFYRRQRGDESPVLVTGIRVKGADRQSDHLPTIDVGNSFGIELELNVLSALHGAHASILLKNSKGEHITILVSFDKDFRLSLGPGRHIVTAQISDLPLAPGLYLVDAGVGQSEVSVAFDLIVDYPLFRVVNSGQVTHWVDRPWGALHCKSVEWTAS